MFEVNLVNGKVVKVGGMLVCEDQRFKEVAPDLFAALEKEPDTNADFEEQSFQIVKFYNKGFEKKDFLIDVYTMRKILSIWNGTFDDKKKE